jgi:hypothetical protein
VAEGYTGEAVISTAADRSGWTTTMPKLKHIALSTQDVEGTARFYVEVFGDINLAILNFKNDAAAGAERGRAWSGIHQHQPAVLREAWFDRWASGIRRRAGVS